MADQTPGVPPADPESQITPPGGPERSASDRAAGMSVQAADMVDDLVANVHDRFIRPVVLGARAVVFGLLIAVLATTVLVLVSVSLVRLLTIYAFDGRVWASYLLLGGLFTAAGLILWAKRSSADPTAATNS